MGTNLPSYNPDALVWLEGHIAQWVADPAGIGVASAVVTDLATEITGVRTAFTSVEQIRSDSKVTTNNFHDMADTMRGNAGAVIGSIKAFADNSADPLLVYTAAGITPADPPSPVPAPEQPTSLEATLLNDGSIDVTWSGKGPAGTVYQIFRKLPTETVFVLMANTGSLSKSWNDAAIPTGTTFATYQVRAVHGEKFSPFSTQFNIQFGTADGAAEGLPLAA